MTTSKYVFPDEISPEIGHLRAKVESMGKLILHHGELLDHLVCRTVDQQNMIQNLRDDVKRLEAGHG